MRERELNAQLVYASSISESSNAASNTGSASSRDPSSPTTEWRSRRQAQAQQGPSAPSVSSATPHEQRHQPAGSPSMEPPTTSEPSVDPRRAAAQAALRRLNPSASASTSPSAVSPNSLPMPPAPPANAAPTPSSSSSSMDANSSAAPVSGFSRRRRNVPCGIQLRVHRRHFQRNSE
ncbi:hypothetical protein GY45DRAFT_1338276 [Cubamyces sp. BRFM 1775]|nr:hypothetical protein GY45DRAFT_1338276 [Cubamyces sp. BRFM 1775]